MKILNRIISPEDMKALLPVLVLVLFSCDEGNSNIERIAGGKKATKGQFPFFAQLVTKIPFNETYHLQIRCGASLILPEWILSAGHCFKPAESSNSSKIDVIMGSNLRFDPDADDDFDVNTVKHFIIHEKYTEVHVTLPDGTVQVGGVHNDIALAKLQRPYAMYKYVRVAYLPPPNFGKFITRCKVGTIVGTGLIYLDDSGKQEVDTHVLYASVTSKTRNQVLSYVPVNISNKFYSEAKWLNGHPLQGDSGGPYVCYANHKPVVYGIVSSISTDQNYSTLVSLYEKVDAQITFIIKTIPSARTNIINSQQDETVTHKSSATVVIYTYCCSITVFLIMYLK